MTDRTRHENFIPIFEVGIHDGNPAVRTYDIDCELTPYDVAGFMVAILDCMVDFAPESEQIEFEATVLKAFKKFAKNRHEHTNKYYIPPEDEDEYND
jgi:hypothetical protein